MLLACRCGAEACNRSADWFTRDQTPATSDSRDRGGLDRQEAAAQRQQSSSYASVTSEASSYARVHGEVARGSADWEDISSVAREQLEDVRYHKAEGIAKVSCATKCHVRRHSQQRSRNTNQAHVKDGVA